MATITKMNFGNMNLNKSEVLFGGENMKVGDKVKAQWSETISDHVTKGKIYEVSEVFVDGYRTFFKIINDKGKSVMPVSVTFTKIVEE
jgi:chitinase